MAPTGDPVIASEVPKALGIKIRLLRYRQR